ncbi:MAG: amidohydrolase family protein, partial [Acidimicrobiia bacterium]|nr:amidohydrolase family protein [Acidimicrobiia bacterium]
MGNCGVGFAPVSPDRRDWLIGLMEGVEDIPGAALSEGIRWEWETFSEYLDAVDRAPKMLDVAAQIPHGAVRAYVMGDRGARNEPATSEDIAAMAAIVRDAIAAGALEDIPGAALSEGIRWEWETFSEYLDAVDRAPKMLDVAAQIPHGAVRAYVMGDRGARNEPATSEDIAAMAAIVRDAIAAGALGFSTSRTIAHMAIDGEPVPGTFAAEDELFGLGNALKDSGGGVFELAPAGALGEDLAAPEREMDWMRRLAAICGRPVSFALTQNDHDPESWRRMLDLCAEAAAEGSNVRPQVAGRPVTLLLG